MCDKLALDSNGVLTYRLDHDEYIKVSAYADISGISVLRIANALAVDTELREKILG